VNRLFSTVRATADPNLVRAFQQKIDFKSIELNCTDSPHLEAARMPEGDHSKRNEKGETLRS